jgi:hypothetical protein
VGEEAKLELLLLVAQADAQQVVPELAAVPSLVLTYNSNFNLAPFPFPFPSSPLLTC